MAGVLRAPDAGLGYHYDPSRKALLTPARDATFFPTGRPAAEAPLCAELSRLAYAEFEHDPGVKTEVETTLRRIGFVGCTFFSAASTQGFLAQDPTGPLWVLAFRGTEIDPEDWATDLDATLVPWPGGGRVHQGFAAALGMVWEPIAAALTSVTGRLLYTGHSLGGALATLAASHRSPQALYSYGSPRVGDAAFVEANGAVEHHRYLNCCDIVARLPPEALMYRHLGPASYLDRRGQLHAAPADSLVVHDQRRARRWYLRRWSWRRGTMWTRDAADHAPINYVSALSAAEGSVR